MTHRRSSAILDARPTPPGRAPHAPDPHFFIARWKRSNLSEMSAYQQYFLDLCDVLGEPKPADVDPDGTFYTFQKGLTTTDDTKGWADVWLRERLGKEYKGKHKDLKAAYQQLLKYREALENRRSSSSATSTASKSTPTSPAPLLEAPSSRRDY